ncbi:MAG: ABC transporter substrate-binding protein [Clostridiaceae bacterium]
MNKNFKEMYISEILDLYPETISVFLANGFQDFKDENLVKRVGPFLKLETALKTRNINIDLFIKFLNEEIESKGLYDSSSTIEDKSLNLLALLPCPLKVSIEDQLIKLIKKVKEENNLNLKYLIDSNSNKSLSYNEYVKEIDNINDLPDIIISSGINVFYFKNFADKFINKGLFIDVSDDNINKSLIDVGIKDPYGEYTIFSMNLLIMVADLTKIGDLPLPECWGDLLKPEYENKVVIRGHNNDNFCETTLLTVFKEHGYQGIKNLGKSVMAGWHPAQMVKVAGTGKSEAPVISVMPYFYAKTIKNLDKVKIIWPKDGAIVSPVTLLVKKDKYEKLKPIAQMFTGTKVGEICADAYFPSVNPEVNNKIPNDVAYNWIGWDYIKENNLEELISNLNKKFLEGFKK